MSLCNAPAAWGCGVVLVRCACTRAPYSSGRIRRSTIHLWNQAALSARVAISASVPAVLDQLVLAGRGHEVAPATARGRGKERVVLLADGLGAEKRRLEQELRDVRPLDVAVAHEDLPAEQILRCDRERELII